MRPNPSTRDLGLLAEVARSITTEERENLLRHLPIADENWQGRCVIEGYRVCPAKIAAACLCAQMPRGQLIEAYARKYGLEPEADVVEPVVSELKIDKQGKLLLEKVNKPDKQGSLF